MTILKLQLILTIICCVRLDEMVKETCLYIFSQRLLQFINSILYSLEGFVVSWGTRIYTWCFFGFASTIQAAIPCHRSCHTVSITAWIRCGIAISKARILSCGDSRRIQTTIIRWQQQHSHHKEDEARKIINDRWTITIVIAIAFLPLAHWVNAITRKTNFTKKLFMTIVGRYYRRRG